MAVVSHYSPRQSRNIRVIKYSVIILLIAAFIRVFIPSTNVMYAMAASQVGEKIATNEKVQEMSSDAFKALHSWIKDQIKEKK